MHSSVVTGSRRWMALARPVMVVLACAVSQPAWTADSDTRDGLTLLQRIQGAASKLNYAGVFTYQQGGAMQSSRVTHVADAQGERERLEVLDGQPLEFLRSNNEVQCLVPQQRKILIEKRPAGDRFPGLMVRGTDHLERHYRLEVAEGLERVADRDCRVLSLVPRDTDRYGYRLCADTASGLLLRAQTLDADDEVVEQVGFITVQIGDGIDRKQLQSRWKTKDWEVVRTKMIPADLAGAGWRVGEAAGFQMVTQLRRTIGGKPDVKQIMLSDGLAAISIFIEPFSGAYPPRQDGRVPRGGAIHATGRRVGDFWITVLGEAPLATIEQVAEAIDYQPGKVLH